MANYPDSNPSRPNINPNSQAAPTTQLDDRNQLWDEVEAIGADLRGPVKSSAATVSARTRRHTFLARTGGSVVTLSASAYPNVRLAVVAGGSQVSGAHRIKTVEIQGLIDSATSQSKWLIPIPQGGPWDLYVEEWV